jgi:sugar phosphate isomerase/epimerase
MAGIDWLRLGGPVTEPCAGPEEWVAALKRRGYSAAYCPVDENAPASEISAYARAAAEAGITIAEVGAWSNPLSRDEAERKGAIKLCQVRLALAEAIGARCCVNIAGSRNPDHWDGPHQDNVSRATFDLIVETVREIIDAVKPSRTFYTLEPMPWVPPDSADSYLAIIKAVDRPACAVHFDPVNLVCSPRIFYDNGAMIRDFFARLGPRIKSCHAKDTALGPKLTAHLDEVRPGLGALDYRVYLSELRKLGPGVPLMIEHLATEEEYRASAEYIRGIAATI